MKLRRFAPKKTPLLVRNLVHARLWTIHVLLTIPIPSITGNDICQKAEIVETRNRAKNGVIFVSFQSSIRSRKRLIFRVIRDLLFRHDNHPVYSLSSHRDIATHSKPCSCLYNEAITSGNRKPPVSLSDQITSEISELTRRIQNDNLARAGLRSQVE